MYLNKNYQEYWRAEKQMKEPQRMFNETTVVIQNMYILEMRIS